ncbi:MAG: ribosome maturation factor RimP [Alphaproteobacteria bacterium]|nr:ribosome maturation factor RimP [Alphaproteobacteria bacterium]
MQKHHLADILEPVIENLGFETVRILTIGETNPILQVMIEHTDYSKDISVDDCALVSRSLSAILDEREPIDGKYVLEVSSPGIDRPLTKLEHFSRYVGYLIKLETVEMVEKRKRFKGTIESVSNEGKIALKMDDVIYNIAYENVSKAKIILTDELWEQYLKAHKKQKN